MGTRSDELKAEIEATRADMTDTVDEMGERISPKRIVERRTDKMRYQMGRVRDAVMGARDQAGSTASGWRSQAGSGLSGVSSSASQAPQAIIDQTRGSPLAAGAIAFATGFLIASALPSSRAERQGAALAADKASPIVDQARDAASQVGSDAKEFAQQAVQDVKQAATSAAEEVKSTARGAGTEVKEAATDTTSSTPRAR